MKQHILLINRVKILEKWFMENTIIRSRKSIII